MSARRAAGAVLAVIAALAAPAAAQKGPAVADVVRAGTEYLAAYAPTVSGVTLEEQYTLIDVSSGRMSTPQRLNSDVVLLNLSGRVIALRDAYAIDNNPLRDRTPRITALLARPTAAGWEQAQAYAAESFRLMKAEIVATLNDPTLALFFLAPANQSRVTYKIDGHKRIAGVEAVGLSFQEPKNRGAEYIVGTRGKAAGSGRLWIDPATGRILQTELSMQSATETARVTVSYAPDSTLDLWLPSQMVDTYRVSEGSTGISSMGTGAGYNVRQEFECRAAYANARLTPIELSVPR